jgi:hypothetical protein
MNYPLPWGEGAALSRCSSSGSATGEGSFARFNITRRTIVFVVGAFLWRLVPPAGQHRQARILRVSGVRGAPAAEVEDRSSIRPDNANVLAMGAQPH